MRLLVSALEPSANIHLKAVIDELGDVDVCGIFDKTLGTPNISADDFGVMGFLDVFAKIKQGKAAIKTLVNLARDADTILLIDAPAFNLPLAKALKKSYPHKVIIYYILPKVWAWKKSRAKKVALYTDIQLSIFPFESRYYPNAVYVGNPLMDEINVFKSSLSDNDTIAFLAGSRNSEIKHLMPIMRAIQRRLSHAQALLAIPPHLSDETIAKIYGDISMFDLRRDTHEALYESSFAFVCSGTATLETALIGTPFLLLYKTNALEFKIGRMIVKLPYVGLANILFNMQNEPPMHPEFLQNDLEIEAMMHAYDHYDRKAFFEKTIRLRTMLGSGANKKVAQIIQASL